VESPRWHLEITEPAQRDLLRLPVETRRRVTTAFDGLTVFPRIGDIKKLAGKDDEYRLRVSDIRVIYRSEKPRRTIVIVAARPRGRVYRD